LGDFPDGWRTNVSAQILIVEDEPAVQELIVINLEQAGHRVMKAASAEAAQVLVREAVPDLILLDWVLPGSSGVEFARRMRSDDRTRSVPIIMLTARAGEQEKLIAFETGADDYVTKPFSTRELNARVKAVLRRYMPEKAEEVMSFSGLTLDPVSHRAISTKGEIFLGATEFRLLYFFMSRPGRVFSRSQLIDQIWGRDAFIEERTVDVHIRRLRVALEPTGHAEILQTVRGVGYRFDKSR
jgi:two-component system, OmpR family, phosphate regulon response regulator PhoB